jgi:N-acetyl sugar amidotransferase
MICTNCIYDDRIEGIYFDSDGICNYCHQIEQLKVTYLTGPDGGQQQLSEIIDKIKKAGKKKKYDCVVGVSGGTDSSYLLMKAVDWGLRPLAVHYDNTWNTALAAKNIKLVTRKLQVDLHTFVVDNVTVDDIKLAFLRSGVREFDADTDIAFVQVLRKVAAKNKIKYILEGHSFMTEGLTPVGANYLDGKYVSSVHKRFGDLKGNSFPNMMFTDFMKWTLFYRQNFIRPLWYLNYDKSTAQKELNLRTGWLNYGGHHLENKASSFAHTIWLPQRFGIDYRILTLAARVRSKDLDRTSAMLLYNKPIEVDPTLLTYLKRRLRMSNQEYLEVMTGEVRSWRDFKTYKRRFELLKPLFFLMAKFNLVPMSFYIKYCHRSKQ